MMKIIRLAAFAAGALALTLLVGGVWTGLLVANLKTGIDVPWSVAVMAVLVTLAWLYLGGR